MPEIGKLDAARRQLTEAIRLWLEDRDALAVHTLTMAAFGILNALSSHTVGEKHRRFMDGFLSTLGYHTFYQLANFLKHADRDASCSIPEPLTQENEYRIGICLTMYRGLNGSLTTEMGAFHLMSLMTYPDHFKVAPDSDKTIEAGAQYAALLARRDLKMRQTLVKVLLSAMEAGHLSPDVRVRRTYQGNQ